MDGFQALCICTHKDCNILLTYCTGFANFAQWSSAFWQKMRFQEIIRILIDFPNLKDPWEYYADRLMQANAPVSAIHNSNYLASFLFRSNLHHSLAWWCSRNSALTMILITIPHSTKEWWKFWWIVQFFRNNRASTFKGLWVSHALCASCECQHWVLLGAWLIWFFNQHMRLSSVQSFDWIRN